MKTPKRRIKFLERSEVEKIIAGIKPKSGREKRDYALMHTLFSTGMRVSEALALQADEVILLLREKGTSELPIIGKGGWQRVVFFSQESKNAIKKYMDSIEWMQVADERLFRITPRAVQKMVKIRAASAGFADRNITPHTFRHSLATHLLQKGANIRIVQEILGHKALGTTMVYTGVTNKDLMEAHARFI